MTAKSGMESMLRSLGLGEVLDAANQLAKSGAINEVIQFAQTVGPIRDQLNRIELNQRIALRSAGLTPCPGPADAELSGPPTVGLISGPSADGQQSRPGTPDGGYSNNVTGGQQFNEAG